MSKMSNICKIHVFIVQDFSNRTLRRVQGGIQSRSHTTWLYIRARDKGGAESGGGTLEPKHYKRYIITRGQQNSVSQGLPLYGK